MTWLKTVEWTGVSVSDVLAIEGQYPGLWEDLATEHWQRALVGKLLKEQQGTKESPETAGDSLVMRQLQALQ